MNLISKVKNKLKNTLLEVDKHSPSPRLYSLIMSEDEKILFDKVVKNSRVYLEFGMGGTTFRALQKSKARVYSIDSSLDWIALMREYRLIRQSEKRRLSLFHVEIGPTRVWGYPVGDASKHLYPDYSARIFDSIEKETIDTVLVDGRFRVACTLKTILECHSNNQLTILIHDFWIREKYHSVLSYLNPIERADSLGVFELKKDIDLEQVQNDYEAYKYIPD